MKLKHCIYVLQSKKDLELYVGYSTNLRRRLSEHFHSKGRSTSLKRPLQLIHTEYYLSQSDALRREKYLKTSKGKRTLRLMLREGLQ